MSDAAEVANIDIYKWVDGIPLSRPKKNIARDFADGVLAAEVVRHFYPKWVEMHNYNASNAMANKQYNWKHLNQRVFRKFGLVLSEEDINSVCSCERGAIEKVLRLIRDQMAVYEEKRRKDASRPPLQRVESNLSDAQPPSPERDLKSDSPEREAEKAAALAAENADLRTRVELLQQKTERLEQLVQLKDQHIEALTRRLRQYE